MTQIRDIDLKLVLAKHSLNILPDADMVRVALDAILMGYDSPSLRQLAGTTENSDEARSLFEKSVKELGLSVPPAQKGALILAQEIARQILNETIKPYEGAKQIWSQIYTRINLPQLTPFVGLASEYEDQPDQREDYSRDIIEQAKLLVSIDSKYGLQNV